jgi:hypothetical protein
METIALVYPNGEFPKVDEILGFFRERGYEYDADINTPSMSKDTSGFYLDIMGRVDTIYIKSMDSTEIPDEVFEFIMTHGEPCEAKAKGATGIHLATVDDDGNLENPQILGYGEFVAALGGDL